LSASIIAKEPNNQIYDFKGTLQLGIANDFIAKESLNLENTLWRDTVLASNGFILGIVIYTGIETKV
jgi:phospholipid-translocating ATPase